MHTFKIIHSFLWCMYVYYKGSCYCVGVEVRGQLWSSFPPTFVRCGKRSLGLHSKCLPVKPQFISFWCFFFSHLNTGIQILKNIRNFTKSYFTKYTVIIPLLSAFSLSFHPSLPSSLLPRIHLLFPLHFPLCLFFLPASLPHRSGYLFSPSWNYKWHVLDLLYLFYLTPFL